MLIPHTSILLNDYNSCSCFNITIVDNIFLEDTETFTINITKYDFLPSSYNFLSTIELMNLEVTIEDDDGKSNCKLCDDNELFLLLRNYNWVHRDTVHDYGD